MKQWREGTVSFPCKRTLKLWKAEKHHSSLLYCCHSVHSHSRLLHWCLFKQAKSSEAKTLWVYLGFSGDYCCKRVCVDLCVLHV